MGEKIKKSNSRLGNLGLVILGMIFVVVTFFGMLFVDLGLQLVGIPGHLADGMARIGIAVIILYFFKKRHTYMTIGLDSRGLGKGFLLGWIVLVAAVINFYDTLGSINWEKALEPKVIDYLFYVIYVLGIGVFEEVLLRGVMLNKMLDKWGNTKAGIYGAVIVSSLVFGVWHLINLLDKPWLIVSTITQVGYAFFIGVFFGAVYLRTKNLWTVILLHAIFDIGGCLDELFIKEITQEITQDIAVGDGLFILLEFSVFLIIGLFYLRKVKVEVQGEAINQPMEMIQG